MVREHIVLWLITKVYNSNCITLTGRAGRHVMNRPTPMLSEDSEGHDFGPGGPGIFRICSELHSEHPIQRALLRGDEEIWLVFH
jgi:hypothetical protein